MPSKRIEYIDTLRVIACFMVIMAHSGVGDAEMFALKSESAFRFFTISSSELFLLLSGMVLLPVHVSMADFYKRRFKKLLPPLFIWSSICLIASLCQGHITAEIALQKFLLMGIRPVIGAYWFIYVMVGLYLLAPILSKWLAEASKKELRFVLLLWVINLLLPHIYLIFPEVRNLCAPHNTSSYRMLNYFGGFLGYWLLGFYLRKYPITSYRSPWWLATVAGCILYPIAMFFAVKQGYDISSIDHRLQIGCLFYVVFWITVVQKHPVKNTKIKELIGSLAKYSFGIYLTHMLVITNLTRPVLHGLKLPVEIEIPAITICTMLICYIALRVLHLLPHSKHVTGV